MAGAELIGPKADVISNVSIDAQVIYGQSGLVRGALDLVFVTCAIDDGRLDAIDLFDPSPVGGQWIAMAVADHHTFVVLVAMLRVFVGRHMGKRFDFNCLLHLRVSHEHAFILSRRTVGDLVQTEGRVWSGIGGHGTINEFAIVHPVGPLDGKAGLGQVAAEDCGGLIHDLRGFSDDVWGCGRTGSPAAQQKGTDSPQQLHGRRIGNH